ncbi:MAG: hypothetical protein K5893_04960 [Prevotella sp.]|nr:hypothetical protein [Prevotella sp.]
MVVLCLFGLCLAQSRQGPRKRMPRKKTDERVYLVHADNLSFDRYGGTKPNAQILRGKVSFRHKGATLTCDSAYFFEETNSFEAFGHVNMKQGDTLRLVSDYALYEGDEQMAYARHNVVLTHRGTKLYTDSLDYDRLYSYGYFFEGGKMVDKQNVLTSDWGEYHTDSRMAMFQYDVTLKNKKFVLTTDTLYYDTHTSLAHIVGPSQINSGKTVIDTDEGYYDSRTEQAQLYSRSTLVNGNKELVGDSLYYDEKNGISEGFNNVIYEDKENKNRMYCDYFWYNEKTGEAYATKRAMLADYSQKDTLFMHADSMKMYTFNIDTDSVWRRIHCFNHVRAYRTDVQAVCDSLVYNTLDSCMTMYKDPITWNGPRQLLGERIKVYMNDSTIERAHVIGQAFSIEKADEEDHYNQISSKEMIALFNNGEIYQSDAMGNVRAVYYPVDDKDSSLIVMDYTETDTMRMYLEARKMKKIWTNKAEGTWYPMTQIPPSKRHLDKFAWFDYIRPIDKNDIFEWRGKKAGSELKNIPRHEAPLQKLPVAATTTNTRDDESVQTTMPPPVSP